MIEPVDLRKDETAVEGGVPNVPGTREPGHYNFGPHAMPDRHVRAIFPR